MRLLNNHEEQELSASWQISNFSPSAQLYHKQRTANSFVKKEIKERTQEIIQQMHEIMREHGLEGEFRWLVAQKDPVRNGELYRFIAGAAPRTLILQHLTLIILHFNRYY